MEHKGLVQRAITAGNLAAHLDGEDRLFDFRTLVLLTVADRSPKLCCIPNSEFRIQKILNLLKAIRLGPEHVNHCDHDADTATPANPGRAGL